MRSGSFGAERSAGQLCVRKIQQHPCSLPISEDELLSHISTGLFVQLRRVIWKWITVSASIPESKRVLLSSAQIHDEELRHFELYPYMVHPFSRARFWWQMFMIPVFLLLYVIFIPLVLAVPETVMWVKVVLDMICWVDIVLFFFSGYYDDRRQVIVMRCDKVVKHYVCTLFLFDLLSSQPLSVYTELLGMHHKNPYKLLLLLKLVRLPTLSHYLHRLGERTNIPTSIVNFIYFTIWIWVLITWTATITFVIIEVQFPGVLKIIGIPQFPLLMVMFRVVRALMGVGITDIINSGEIIMLFEIAGITFGSLLEIIILARMMQVFSKRTTTRNKFNLLLEEIGEYMTYKELPSRLRHKILHYVNFKFQKHIFREEDIMNNLSSLLKQEILLYRCQKMVEKVDFFKDLPTHVMLRIVAKLRSEIFLPTDVIVLAGYAGRAMYFIYMGTVAVYTESGKEICHLDDGSHFGEIALIINEPRVATVIAVKECELFKLSRRDFQEAIEPFPDLNKKIRKVAMRRLVNTLQMMSEEKVTLKAKAWKATDDSDEEYEL